MKIIAFLTELDLLGQESKWLDIQRLKIKQSWLRYLFLAIYLSPLYSYYLLLFCVPFDFSFAYRHVKTMPQQKFEHSSAQTPLSNHSKSRYRQKINNEEDKPVGGGKTEGLFWLKTFGLQACFRTLACYTGDVNK